MVSKWKATKVSDLLSIKHGFAFKGEYFTEEETEYQLTTPGNFSISGGFQDIKPKYYDGPIPSDYVLSPGQIIVTMTDLSKKSDTLGFAAVIPNDEKTWLHNQRVGLIQIHDLEACNPVFINYLFRTHEYRSWVIGSATGTTVKHTSPSRITSYEFLLPPLSEQKAIAHILGSLDDKIELNRQMNETVEAMAQALFKSWFVDFDPVIDNALLAGKAIPELLKERAELRQAQLDSGKAKANSEINDLFPSEFEFTEDLGWIPKGWSVKSFSHLANLDTTSVKPSLEPEKIWEHYSIPAFDVDESPVFDLGETIKSNKYKVDKNAILVSKLNPETERIWWVDIGDEDSAICSTEFMQFIPKKVGHRGYIYNLVRSYPFQVEILSRVTGSTGSRQRAQPKSVAEIAVVIPNTELIDKFSEISDNLKSKVSGNISQNTKLAKLRDTLLPKLMSGELRIADAEKLVADI